MRKSVPGTCTYKFDCKLNERATVNPYLDFGLKVGKVEIPKHLEI